MASRWITSDRTSLSLSSGNTLTFAGNLAPYQRIDLLLESFAQVRLGNQAARLKC